jgi:hypothetical protein
MRQLYQSYTYEGMLAGLPYKSLNDRIIAEALKLADENPLLESGKTVLIEPRITLIKGRTVPPREGEVPESSPHLPEVTCIGRLWVSYIEALTVVWFQDRMAMPIDADVLERIKALDWRAVAKEIDY